jgi:hypothetical protein
VVFYIERFIPKLVPGKDTLRVRRRDTPSFDTPVVTDLGEGARQKILIHQVFNRSVKVWVRCEGLFHPHVPCPLTDWKKELVRKGKI